MATFDQKKLKNTFVNRLKTQSRMSGDLKVKPWLPINFLKKNYPDCTQKFIIEIYKRLYIIVDEGSLKAKHILVKDIDKLEIDNRGIVSCYVQNKPYTVLTSTILNRKVPMIIDPSIPANEALRYIEIDHVTPIDKTLRDLNSQSKLPKLGEISQYISDGKNDYIAEYIAEYSKEHNANPKKLPNLDTMAAASKLRCLDKSYINKTKAAIERELKRIAKDSYYRLILASDNLSKSNLFEYKKIYKIKYRREYIAVVEDNNVFDQNGPAVIYQKLNNKQKPDLLITSETNFNNITTGASQCRLAQVPIAFL